MNGVAASRNPRMASDRRGVIALGVLFAALSGCAMEMRREHPTLCRGDEKSWVRDVLYLGTTGAHGGGVDQSQWLQFQRDTLLAQFPNGFSVLGAAGHWRDDKGKDFDEQVRVLVIDHADDAASNAGVQRVITDYRTRFDQEAVLRERSSVCVSFNDKN